MLLIVGLGNFGKKYENTYHNMGFCVVDKIAKHFEEKFSLKECDSLVCKFFYQKETYILAKPQTYMNDSGLAVLELCKKYKIKPTENLIVVSDDVSLPAGSIRIKENGSSGSHNGLKDIIEKLGINGFKRIKIAIGPKPAQIDLANFVLSKFKEDSAVSRSIELGYKACLDYISENNIQNLMQKYNNKNVSINC